MQVVPGGFVSATQAARELVDFATERLDIMNPYLAELIVADDRVQFGTLNLDAWALYRNFEIALMVDGADVADTLVARAIEPAISRAEPGARQGGLDDLRNWFADKLTYFL